MMSEKTIKWIIYLLLSCFVCYALFLHIYDRDALYGLCHEDGPIETLTAVFYFIASMFFIYACKKNGFRNIWYWGFFLLFLVIAGEEISWGQRLFQLKTPGILLDINVQKEANLHNIMGIHGNIRMLGLIVFTGICYFIPITDRLIAPLRVLYEKLKLPVYPLWLIGLPTIGLLFMVVPRLFFHEIVFNLDEMGEIFFSVGFLLFACEEMGKTRSA